MPLLQTRVSARVYLLILIEAALLGACSIAAVFLAGPIDASLYLTYENGWLYIVAIVVTFLVASYLLDLYKEIRIRSRMLLILQVAHLIGIIFIVQAVLAFINPDLVPPQPVGLTGTRTVTTSRR